MLSTLQDGIDPLAERELARSADKRGRADAATIADVAERWLAALDVDRGRRWAGEARRFFKAHVAPAMGAVRVRDLATRDVME